MGQLCENVVNLFGQERVDFCLIGFRCQDARHAVLVIEELVPRRTDDGRGDDGEGSMESIARWPQSTWRARSEGTAEHTAEWGGRRAQDWRGIPRGPAEGKPVSRTVGAVRASWPF